MSVAGGLPRAVERAVVHGCQSLQIFAKNASQWRGRAVPDDEIRAFRKGVDAARFDVVVSHASYLINLAATEDALARQSIDAMRDEVDRAEALGLLGVVLHPGCYTSGSAEQGIVLVARRLVEILSSRPKGRTMILLEHTAGQGTALGARFEELAAMLAHAGHPPRLGVCLDTCHLLASGYDIVSEDGYLKTFADF